MTLPIAYTIPFIPSDNNYTLGVILGGVKYWFDTHWNQPEAAWYFDLYQEDFTPICLGIKVVLGTNLGKRSSDPFFQANVLRALDTTNSGVDAAYDDLGARVIVTHFSLTELINFDPNDS